MEKNKEFINDYRRMGIVIDLLEDGTVKVTQTRLINGYMICGTRTSLEMACMTMI